MPDWMINLAARIGGIGHLWGFLDGYKTKIAGVAGLLTGLAGVVQEVAPLINNHDLAAILAFAKHLPADQSWLALLAGLGALGLGHKMDKAAAAAAPISDAPAQ